MNETIIKFKNLLTKEVSEIKYNANEDHAIELLKREYAATGVQILNIINLEDQEIYNKIEEIKQTQIKETIKKIKSTVKSFIKNLIILKIKRKKKQYHVNILMI